LHWTKKRSNMKNKFDLKKFLIENKLTSNSRKLEEENEINWDEDLIYTGTNDDGIKTFTPLAQYKKSQHHSALYPMQEAFKQAGISMGEEIIVITHGPFLRHQDQEEEADTGKASEFIESLEYDRLEAIEQAKNYIKSCSYREVAGWMGRKTGRSISAPGLRKVLNRSE